MKRKTSTKSRPKTTTYPTFLELFEGCLYDLFSPKSKNRLVDYEFVSNIFSISLFATYLTALNTLATYLVAFIGIFIGTSMIAHQTNTSNNYIYAAEASELAQNVNTQQEVLGTTTVNPSDYDCLFTIENTSYTSSSVYKLTDQTVTVCASNVPQNASWYVASESNILPVNVLSSTYDSDCTILTNLNYGDTLYVSSNASEVSEVNSCFIRFE